MATDSIIVYQSQAHKALDDMVMSGDLVPVFAGIFAGALVFACLVKLNDVVYKRFNQTNWYNKLYQTFNWLPVNGLFGFIGGFVAVSVCKWMWL